MPDYPFIRAHLLYRDPSFGQCCTRTDGPLRISCVSQRKWKPVSALLVTDSGETIYDSKWDGRIYRRGGVKQERGGTNTGPQC